jgi:hypothetical protein
MKYIIPYSSYLTEALKLSTAKEYSKGWDKSRWESLFQRYTEDPKAYRIYLPFVPAKVEAEVPPVIDTFLNSIGWAVTDYHQGLAREESSGRAMKIGKIINKEGDDTLLKIYTEDPGRLRPREWEIVVSRHPYDIAGMSTGRGWTSCMELGVKDRGELYIPKDIKAGAVIAYLVRKGDRNLENPAARVLIKPYYSIQDPNEVILVADRTIYGQFIPGFLDAVQDWLDEVNRGKSGVYKIDPRLYPENDEYDATIVAQGILDSGSLSATSIYYYALIPEAEPSILAQLAGSKEADTKALSSIALHPNTPADTLTQLASSGNSTIKRAVAANSATPVEIRIGLIEKLTKKQLLQLMHNSGLGGGSLTADLISNIWNRTSPSEDPMSIDSEIRLQLSIQRDIPLSVLREMAVDPYPNIRLNSIRNREIADLLTDDPNSSVIDSAKRFLAKLG